MVLEKELETYKNNKEKLLKEANGKYVLIKDTEVIGVFESENDAINMGTIKFGNNPFLVKKISEVDETQTYWSGLVTIGR